MKPKGYPKTGGRKTGTPNKLPAVRATFERVFNELQAQPDEALSRLDNWARLNPTEFYRLASKLIPIDMAVQGGIVLNVITGVPREDQPETIEHNDCTDLL